MDGALKVPSQEEFAAFVPASGGRVWGGIGSHWRCPGCGRTKFELLRYLEGKGWFAQIVTHKGKGARRGLKEKICGDCANVQADLKNAMPEFAGEWSLTADEIGSVIAPRAHSKHKIDFDQARPLMVRLREMPVLVVAPLAISSPPPPPSKEQFAQSKSYSAKLQALAGPDWVCPVCGRSVYEMARWSRARPSKEKEAELTHALARHHDHGAHESEKIDGRFPVTMVCRDCNNVDGRVKSRLRGLPKKGWSFAPDEIRSVISIEAHRRHKIDWEKARELVDKILAAVSIP